MRIELMAAVLTCAVASPAGAVTVLPISPIAETFEGFAVGDQVALPWVTGFPLLQSAVGTVVDLGDGHGKVLRLPSVTASLGTVSSFFVEASLVSGNERQFLTIDFDELFKADKPSVRTPILDVWGRGALYSWNVRKVYATSYIDNVTFSVASAYVPEPATWALMILGFGAIGGAMRRRQSVPAKVRFA